MSELVFFYGAMGSSKTATALMTAYNYEERGHKCLLVKSSLDTRDGINMIKSRIGISKKCISVEQLLTMRENIASYDVVIIDEAQFLTEREVDFIANIVDECGVSVLAYGLRTDFRNKFFEGSRRLMEVADEIKEIKTMCWCGNKATCNARYDDNGIIKEGNQIVVGANEMYISVCRKHYISGELFGPSEAELDSVTDSRGFIWYNANKTLPAENQHVIVAFDDSALTAPYNKGTAIDFLNRNAKGSLCWVRSGNTSRKIVAWCEIPSKKSDDWVEVSTGSLPPTSKPVLVSRDDGIFVDSYNAGRWRKADEGDVIAWTFFPIFDKNFF